MSQELNKGIQQSTIDLLKKEEGVRDVVYKDSVGKDTVGIGHLVIPADALKFGDKISSDKINELAKKDLQTAANSVNSSIKVPLNQNQFDALVSLVYNIGIGAFQRSTLVKYINAGNSQQDITNAWLAWKNAGGKPILLNRRQREVDLYFYKSIADSTIEFAKKKPLITIVITTVLLVSVYVLVVSLKTKTK